MFLSLLDLFRQQTGAPLLSPVPAGAEWADEGGDLLLRLALPGIDPRTVQLQVTESSLTLAGSRSHEERTEGEGYYQATSESGAFARTLPLPVRVLPGESRAGWLPGEVLEVRLKKA